MSDLVRGVESVELGGWRWVDPPAPLPHMVRPRKDWSSVAVVLRENPARWSRVDSGVKRHALDTVAARIRKGQGPWAPAASFEATVRRVADVGPPAGAVYGLYVRWVGELEEL